MHAYRTDRTKKEGLSSSYTFRIPILILTMRNEGGSQFCWNNESKSVKRVGSTETPLDRLHTFPTYLPLSGTH
jgi:hypothetical protein